MIDEEIVKRNQWHQQASLLGIVVNALLSFSKIGIALMTHSVALLSDGVNNLFDMTSSIVMMISGFLARRPADEQHPYGHGRYEYIGSLMIALIILVTAFELSKSAIDKIAHPTPLNGNIWMWIIIFVSIMLKSGLWIWNYRGYQQTKSPLLKANYLDCSVDILSSVAILVVVSLESLFHFSLDGVVGLLLVVVIGWSAIRLLLENLTALLGQQVSHEVIDQMTQIIESFPQVLGFHNLKAHEYGPSRIEASVDLELEDILTLTQAHQLIDLIEYEVQQQLGIHLSIHIDPISTNSIMTKQVTQDVLSACSHPDMIMRVRVIQGYQKMSVLVIVHELSVKDKLKSEIETRYPNYKVTVKKG